MLHEAWVPVLFSVHPGIVVRALAPKSPMRRVVAATLGAAGVSPAAESMIAILTEVAKRYTDGPKAPPSGVAARH